MMEIMDALNAGQTPPPSLPSSLGSDGLYAGVAAADGGLGPGEGGQQDGGTLEPWLQENMTEVRERFRAIPPSSISLGEVVI